MYLMTQEKTNCINGFKKTYAYTESYAIVGKTFVTALIFNGKKMNE